MQIGNARRKDSFLILIPCVLSLCSFFFLLSGPPSRIRPQSDESIDAPTSEIDSSFVIGVDKEKFYEEMVSRLRRNGRRSDSAIASLKWWNSSLQFDTFHRKSVELKDGKKAEIILMESPSFSIPGTDFSLAFLLIDNTILDWRSCVTSTRTATQQLLVEDVDGDGYSDLAFRYEDGFWGKVDERKHSLPNDDRVWLYAFRITSHGFQSIFPLKEKTVHLHSQSCEQNGLVVTVDSMPDSIKEGTAFEVVLSCVNQSDRIIPIKNKFLSLEGDGLCGTSCDTSTHPKSLNPGERFYVNLVVLIGKPKSMNLKVKPSIETFSLPLTSPLTSGLFDE